MTVPDIAQPILYLGAAGFAAGGAVVLLLTRTPQLALRTASAFGMKAAKAAVVGGVVVSVVSTGALGYDAWRAGPPLAAGGHPRATALAVAPAKQRAELERPAAVEEEPRREAVALSQVAVYVQLADDVTSKDRTRANWSDLAKVDGQVRLEVVGLDSLRDPSGWWTVCVGVPTAAFRVWKGTEGWAVYGPEHSHPVGTPGRDPNPTVYQTYSLTFRVPDQPGRHYMLDAPLRLSRGAPGVHKVGLGVAKGRATVGPDCRECFQPHTSTLTVDCSQ